MPFLASCMLRLRASVPRLPISTKNPCQAILVATHSVGWGNSRPLGGWTTKNRDIELSYMLLIPRSTALGHKPVFGRRANILYIHYDNNIVFRRIESWWLVWEMIQVLANMNVS